MVKEVPVLIAGGGSVGLSVAAELGWRGINCLAVEEGAGLNPHPRANAVANRTMEYYRRWGIDKAITDAGIPPDHPADYYWLSSLHGKQLHRVSLPPFKKIREVKDSAADYVQTTQYFVSKVDQPNGYLLIRASTWFLTNPKFTQGHTIGIPTYPRWPWPRGHTGRVWGCVVLIVDLLETRTAHRPRKPSFQWQPGRSYTNFILGHSMEAYQANCDDIATGFIESDALAVSLEALINESDPVWEGTLTDLMGKLTGLDADFRAPEWAIK